MALFPMLLTAISTFGYAEIIPATKNATDPVSQKPRVLETVPGNDALQSEDLGPYNPGAPRGGRHLTGARMGRGWDEGVLSYVFAASVNKTERATIQTTLKALMSEVGDGGCLRIQEVPKTYKGPYVTIQTKQNQGCNSWLGLTDKAREHTHDLNLDYDGCLSAGTIKHEFLHALGFIHTHQRPDRHNYLTVQTQHIDVGNHDQFQQEDAEDILTWGIGYDPQSIMHYKDDSFTVSRDDPNTLDVDESKTMKAVDGSGLTLKSVRTQYLTKSDVRFVQKFYNCKVTGAGSEDGGVGNWVSGKDAGIGAPPFIPGGKLPGTNGPTPLQRRDDDKGWNQAEKTCKDFEGKFTSIWLPFMSCSEHKALGSCSTNSSHESTMIKYCPVTCRLAGCIPFKEYLATSQNISGASSTNTASSTTTTTTTTTTTRKPVFRFASVTPVKPILRTYQTLPPVTRRTYSTPAPVTHQPLTHRTRTRHGRHGKNDRNDSSSSDDSGHSRQPKKWVGDMKSELKKVKNIFSSWH